MKVKFETILEKGLSLDERVPDAILQEALASVPGFSLVSASPLAAHLSRAGDTVLLKGSLNVEAKAPCKRCLVDVKVPIPLSFSMTLVPAGKVVDDEFDGEGEDDEEAPVAGTFDLEDVDVDTFDGKTIDLDPIVREQLMLALPVAVVCREDCRGLCTNCGQNLNEKVCGCDTRAPDPRWEKLKEIKLN